MVAQDDRAKTQQALDLSLQLALRQKGVSQATLQVSRLASLVACVRSLADIVNLVAPCCYTIGLYRMTDAPLQI